MTLPELGRSGSFVHETFLLFLWGRAVKATGKSFNQLDIEYKSFLLLDRFSDSLLEVRLYFLQQLPFVQDLSTPWPQSTGLRRHLFLEMNVPGMPSRRSRSIMQVVRQRFLSHYCSFQRGRTPVFFPPQIKNRCCSFFTTVWSARSNIFTRNAWSPSREGSKLRSLRERLAPQLVHPSCPPDPAGEPRGGSLQILTALMIVMGICYGDIWYMSTFNRFLGFERWFVS